jgi:hypothetical protein
MKNRSFSDLIRACKQAGAIHPVQTAAGCWKAIQSGRSTIAEVIDAYRYWRPEQFRETRHLDPPPNPPLDDYALSPAAIRAGVDRAIRTMKEQI